MIIFSNTFSPRKIAIYYQYLIFKEHAARQAIVSISVGRKIGGKLSEVTVMRAMQPSTEIFIKLVYRMKTLNFNIIRVHALNSEKSTTILQTYLAVIHFPSKLSILTWALFSLSSCCCSLLFSRFSCNFSTSFTQLDFLRA